MIEPEGVNAVERTSLKIKDKSRKLPEPIVVQAKINGHPIRALLDTGSMADFLSTTVVDQLRLPKEIYEKPLSVQLAVHGSRSKINCGTTVKFQYQTIDCDRRFDIANLDNYDAILGTPFLYQHQVTIGFNPSRVIVGSSEPLEMNGPEVTTITSASADLLNEGLDEVRKRLRQEAGDLCPDTSKTALPPFRAVNHTIPLIDEKKIYRFRPSKCPEAFRDQWRKKKDAYLSTGRWRTATGHNAIPLLMIPKVALRDKILAAIDEFAVIVTQVFSSQVVEAAGACGNPFEVADGVAMVGGEMRIALEDCGLEVVQGDASDSLIEIAHPSICLRVSIADCPVNFLDFADSGSTT